MERRAQFLVTWELRIVRDTGAGLGSCFRKSRKLFGPEKPFVKFRSVYYVKLVFSHIVKGIKIKTTAKFRASRRFCIEDTKIQRELSPEKLPKSFGTSREQLQNTQPTLFPPGGILRRTVQKTIEVILMQMNVPGILQISSFEGWPLTQKFYVHKHAILRTSQNRA